MTLELPDAARASVAYVRPVLLSALLASFWLSSALTTSAADPDLKVESVKLFTAANGQVNEQVIQYTIVNAGDEDSPTPLAKLTITGGNATFPDGRKEDFLNIPGLKAKDGSFTGFALLAGACDGTFVVLSLAATGEANIANNEFGPVKLCPELPPPPAPASGPDDDIDFGGCVCDPIRVPVLSNVEFVRPAGIAYNWVTSGNQADAVRLNIYQGETFLGYHDTQMTESRSAIVIFQAPTVFKPNTHYCVGIVAYDGTGDAQTSRFSNESERQCFTTN